MTSVRVDAGGEEQLHHHPHGPSAGSLAVGVLGLAASWAVQTGVRRERIEQKITWFHGESDEVFGSPRILADLREDGEIISR